MAQGGQRLIGSLDTRPHFHGAIENRRQCLARTLTRLTRDRLSEPAEVRANVARAERKPIILSPTARKSSSVKRLNVARSPMVPATPSMHAGAIGLLPKSPLAFRTAPPTRSASLPKCCPDARGKNMGVLISPDIDAQLRKQFD